MGLFSELALGVIAFIIGSEMRMGILSKAGKEITTILFSQVLGTCLLVALGVYFFTGRIDMAFIFGALAAATAPAGTAVVLQEFKAKGSLTNIIYALVGLDDGVTIIIYVFAIALAKVFFLHAALSFFEIIIALKEIAGSIFLGGLIGASSGYLLRKIRRRNDVLVISLGAVFICTGLSEYFHFSLILSNLTFGMVFANLFLIANRRAYEAIQSITSPLYIIFFVVAGAHLQFSRLLDIKFLGLVYIICRTLGKIGGSYFGAVISKSDSIIKKYVGIGILPQAGVAIGLAILVAKEFSPLGPAGRDLAITVVNTITVSTIVFEIIGPIGTKIAISKAGEIGKRR
jgi:Kef-type K+ transport system membrane component KefB